MRKPVLGEKEEIDQKRVSRGSIKKNVGTEEKALGPLRAI